MSQTTNSLGQPVGLPIEDALPRPFPERRVLQGRYGRLEALGEHHAEGLFEAFALDSDGGNWTYLPDTPWASVDQARQWCRRMAASHDPLFWCVIDSQERPVGHLSLLRITPAVGSIEVGYIHFSPLMQRNPLATEAQFLLMQEVFDGLGYRRYEWKCDALNAPSRAAAQRLGFQFEGVFRQATVYKGRNRDTAWFSVLDGEWRAVKAGFTAWLDPSNFDAEGQQKASLASLREA